MMNEKNTFQAEFNFEKNINLNNVKLKNIYNCGP